MLNETITLDIWGRNLELEIIFDCFENEEITSIQKDTLENFKSNSEQILNDSYYKIKDYCTENFASLIADNFDNIYRYVKPKQIYIKRSVTNKKIAGLLCNFKFDIEHGLAVYIEDGKVTKVGSQDIIL